MIDIKKYQNKVSEYKTYVAGRLRSVEGQKIKESIPKQEKYLASTKYDGHFYTLIKENDQIIFINHRDKIIEKHPLIDQITEALNDVKQVVIPGEIYLESEERTRSFNVTKAITDQDPNLRFAAFDILEHNSEAITAASANVFDRFDLLKEILPNKSVIHVAHHEIFESKNDIEEMFNNHVASENAEGVVVKSIAPGGFKIKPKFTLDAVIVGFAEGDGDRAGLLRDFLLAFIRPDGTYQLFAHMSHGFSEEQRKDLLVEYKKKVVASSFIEVARNKLAFHMVKPETVVEFSCLDVINEDSKGFIHKMSLTYDEKTGYKPSRLFPSVSVTIPLFIRFRDDKLPNKEDVRFAQVENIVSFEEKEIAVEDLKPSEILDRKVYTKESKDTTMIRKFIIAKTNKEESGNFPAYIFHYTDYSPNRADPLKRDVKISSSEDQIKSILDAAITKNIKKGWNLVS